ncbi:tripartite tricarboxylate transporter substrate binding protein [Microbacterium betulae]|uniref:Tripartite tricarboxylate transporter substrate binding protein n=1 Tax=Microbacterium betulae TaxID=2981139 RepID=A0AA97I5L7_9MICO|nr:tripartite tricarboxylate transporter substrate binding protein [Microbacterium sp. AB]WOF22227.1 tripartite tricarboxylate transporter substrate binding protein [Microbacterium sp. AB]
MKAIRLAGAVALTASALALTSCGGNLSWMPGSADFPTGPVTITVGQAPGGSSDLVARAVAEGMAASLDVAVPVLNKEGANGALATEQVAASAPDGYELLMLNASLITITPLAVSPAEAVSLDDLTVLKGLSQDDYVLVASPASGFESLDDLIAAPDLDYGTTGVGTGSQLAQAILFAEADVAGEAVPFDSGSPALTAVMGDQMQVATVQLGEAKPQIDAGTVTPLVVFSEERNAFVPEVPTAAELGYEVPVAQYRAIAGPADMPEDVQDRLVDAIDDAIASDAYRAFNESSLLTPREISGDEVVAEWTELAETYRALAEEHDISLTG